MQNRYTGDIGDFGKLGLLRQLSQAELTIGVNWYLTPDETHNGDGRHTAYLKNDAFRACDAQLWLRLGQIVDSGKREISELERSDILNAAFFSQTLDFNGENRSERQAHRMDWHSQAMQQLRGCDIVFADPDNGLIVPSADNTPKSNKFVLPPELADYYRAGASVIYYQHKARRPDSFYTEQNKQLVASGAFPEAESLGLKFKTTSQRYYFFLMQPQHAQTITRCVEQMMSTRWQNHFEIV
jgi:hypothetical protein